MSLKLIFCKHTKLTWDLFMQVCPVSHHLPVSHSSWLGQPKVYGDEHKGCLQDGCKDLGRAFPLKGWCCKPVACFLVEDCIEVCPDGVTINFLLFLTWIIVESQNRRKIWVGKDLKDLLVPTPLLQAGISPTRSGCPWLHPTWPWYFC